MEQFKGQPRLPKFAVPKRYDVRLMPDLVACKFGGSVDIDLDIVADTKFIVLNAAELSVNAGSVSFAHGGSSKVFKPSKAETFEDDGILVLEFGEMLPIGSGVLVIEFEGILNDKMKGFYRSTYEHNGEKKNMAVTQFEPVDARRCFPCWDEPACKVTIAVAHELAHQWFGNLVTKEWWTHLWLNEGFATWVSYLATDSLFPEWKIWTQFLDEVTAGLKLDGLEESHPIEVEINHAAEIDEILDAISYKKGAAVIRMLQSYLGAEVFQRSLASYIKKHAYSNAKTEDLWAALEEGSGESVNKLMSSWTQQKGYPVISVKVKDQKLEFNQTQFYSSGSQGDGQWIVPITLSCGSYDARKNFLLQAKSETLDIKEFLGCSVGKAGCGGTSNKDNALCSWIKVNVDQTGFYRVKYEDELAAALRNAIEKKQLSETDRFGILDDSFALSMARKQSFASLLTLLSAYREELDYIVLSNLITISYNLARIAVDAVPGLLDHIKQFFIGLFQYSAERLGWQPKPGESHLDAMLRGEILTALAVFGHDLTLDEASRRFHAFIEDRNTPLLPPDVRKAAYVAVMQRTSVSDRSGYESLVILYRESDLSQEKTRILGSLASCPDPNITLEVLHFILTPEVRSQDAVFGLTVSNEGRETAWTWMKDNWEHISKTWGSGLLIPRFVSEIVSPFASFDKVKEVDEFFKAHPNPKITRTVKQSIERVQINAKWVQSVQSERNLADVATELAYGKY